MSDTYSDRPTDGTADAGTDTSTGTTPRPRDVTIQLSGPFVESLTPDQLSRYVEIVTALHGQASNPGTREGLDQSEIQTGEADDDADRLAEEAPAMENTLAEQLLAAGIAVPEQNIALLASQIRQASAGQLSIITDAGRILTGRSDAADPEPSSRSTEDPDHPDRPVYS